jgi:hypothetical protein
MILRKIRSSRLYNKIVGRNDTQKVLLGKILAETNNKKSNVNSLSDIEFKVFSQWGDDGIIQYLINKVDIANKIFVEFGVETYHEANTRFLLINNNWSGLVIDGSSSNINSIKKQDIYWQYDLIAKESFITKDNINELISSEGISGEIGILSVDIDGNDYWVLKEINVINPVIIITEYNAVFGKEKALTVPYDSGFIRAKKHYSNLYWGASLGAFCSLTKEMGYSFVGCNNNGNNAYFIRNDRVGSIPVIKTYKEGFIDSKFRECRDVNGKLTFRRGNDRLNLISGQEVINVETNQREKL